jgi:hypothetical protein
MVPPQVSDLPAERRDGRSKLPPNGAQAKTMGTSRNQRARSFASLRITFPLTLLVGRGG